MARGMVGIGSAATVSTEKLAIALTWLPLLACVAAVVALCIKLARHRVLHTGSETDGERMELRNGGDALSSNVQMKRNSLKNSFSFKRSFSRSVNSTVKGNVSSEDMSVEPTALWQKNLASNHRYCFGVSHADGGAYLHNLCSNESPQHCTMQSTQFMEDEAVASVKPKIFQDHIYNTVYTRKTPI